VPAIAAALDPASATTWFTFRKGVTTDARTRKLVGRAGTTGGTKTIMLLTALPAAGIIVAVPPLWIVTPFVWVGLLLASIVLLARGRTYVLTSDGRAAAAHWLGVRSFIADHGNFDDLPPAAVAVWDRYVAYGAAMDLSGDAVHGLITELRTTMSFGDIHHAASAVHQLMRARKDPQANLEFRLQALKREFGDGATADAMFGPSSPDFWTLVDHTARAYPIAAMSAMTDGDAFRAAAHARLAELESAAPADLRGDLAVLADAARKAVDAMATHNEDVMKALERDPEFTSPEVRAAAQRFATVALAHLPADSRVTAMLERASTPHP
jgi:hypothetical protein